jgi:hypothetical protein
MSAFMSDGDIAAAIGWTYEPQFPGDRSGYWTAGDGERYATKELPDFTASLDAFCRVEEEIRRRDVQDSFLDALERLVSPYGDMGERAIQWALMRATPTQRCEAALEVLRSPYSKNGWWL